MTPNDQLSIENLMEAYDLRDILDAMADRALWYVGQWAPTHPSLSRLWLHRANHLRLAALAIPEET